MQSVTSRWKKRQWRVYWHLSGGLAIGLTYWLYADLTKGLALAILGLLMLAHWILEALRRKLPNLNERLMREASLLARDRERNAIFTSTWFVTSSLVAIAFFERDIASAAILFLTVGDSAGCVVGTLNHDRHMLRKGKTLWGTLGCLVACCLVAYLIGIVGSPPLYVLIAGAFIATATEYFSGAYDNLFIPLAAGGGMTLLLQTI